MCKPIADLGDLICQHLTCCYASGERPALVKMAEEIRATHMRNRYAARLGIELARHHDA
jgi:hypothetical protein